MKTKEEIEQLATKHYRSNGSGGGQYTEGLQEGRLIGYVDGYTQCQEDMAKLTFVPGLDKETLDELFDLHDDDDFIHEDSDKKYTEEDMAKLLQYLLDDKESILLNNGISYEKIKHLLNKQNKKSDVICPKCKGVNEYFETKDSYYRCAYTDCQHIFN